MLPYIYLAILHSSFSFIPFLIKKSRYLFIPQIIILILIYKALQKAEKKSFHSKCNSINYSITHTDRDRRKKSIDERYSKPVQFVVENVHASPACFIFLILCVHEWQFM